MLIHLPAREKRSSGSEGNRVEGNKDFSGWDRWDRLFLGRQEWRALKLFTLYRIRQSLSQNADMCCRGEHGFGKKKSKRRNKAVIAERRPSEVFVYERK